MNAAVVEAFDRPPRYTTIADPVPSENELLVEVTAAALHPIVRALANGTHYGSTGQLNFVPGVDGVGRLPDGSRVYFGRTNDLYGTFAERSITQSWLTLPLPDSLDDATAAAMMNPGMSSWAALTARAKFAAGESVLILGATGIAGHLAVQIARRLGATRVIAAGRNPEALQQAATLGADATISLEQDPDALVADFRKHLSESKIDVVLDYLWGAPAEVGPRRHLAEGPGARVTPHSLRADRQFCRAEDLPRRSNPAQLRPRTPGQRIRQRVAPGNHESRRGIHPGR